MRFKHYNKSEEGGGGKNFLKIADGKSVVGIFRGDPREIQTHWIGSRSYICTEDASCQHCQAGLDPSFRFRINVIINENGAYVAKVWEQGKRVYNQLAALAESGYELEKTIVQISRQGDTKDNTVYTVLPRPGKLGIVDAVTEKKIASVALIPLGGDEKPAEPVVQEHGGVTEDDIPF